MATKKPQIKPSAKRSSSKVTKKSSPAPVDPFDGIDPRKELLARVAGNIAGTLVSTPSPSIASADAVATIAVDIAERILQKAGVTSRLPLERKHREPARDQQAPTFGG